MKACPCLVCLCLVFRVMQTGAVGSSARRAPSRRTSSPVNSFRPAKSRPRSTSPSPLWAPVNSLQLALDLRTSFPSPRQTRVSVFKSSKRNLHCTVQSRHANNKGLTKSGFDNEPSWLLDVRPAYISLSASPFCARSKYLRNYLVRRKRLSFRAKSAFQARRRLRISRSARL